MLLSGDCKLMWHKAEMESVGGTKIDERRSDCSQRSWVQFSVVRLHMNESQSHNKRLLWFDCKKLPQSWEQSEGRTGTLSRFQWTIISGEITPFSCLFIGQIGKYRPPIGCCQLLPLSHNPHTVTREGSQWQCWRCYALTVSVQLIATTLTQNTTTKQ